MVVLTIAVLIPVLARPQRAQLVVDSLARSSRAIDLEPVFICSQGDDEEIAAAKKTGAQVIVASWPAGRGDYARKINLAFAQTDAEFAFLGADDLSFRLGWAETATACSADTGACVVGTNDATNPRVKAGRHSTHSLVRREYGECGVIDDPTKLLHDGYWHNFVDDEAVQTAMARETYAQALDSVVEHLHPGWRKAPDDATYARGRAHFADDQRLYARRKRLWQ